MQRCGERHPEQGYMVCSFVVGVGLVGKQRHVADAAAGEAHHEQVWNQEHQRCRHVDVRIVAQGAFIRKQQQIAGAYQSQKEHRHEERRDSAQE